MVAPNNYRELFGAVLGCSFCLMFVFVSMYFLFSHFSQVYQEEKDAKSVILTGESSPFARMRNFKLEIVWVDQSKEGPFFLSAGYADFFQTENKVVMHGGVHLNYNDMKIEGVSLIGDFNSGKVISDEPVLITHLYGQQQAGSFCLTTSDKKIHFDSFVEAEFMVPELQQDL